MGITTLTSNIIQPTKPKSAYFTAGTTIASGTYSTLLSIASGKGLVSKIIFGCVLTGVWQANTSLNIRITVDGTQYTLSNSLTNSFNNNFMRGTEHNAMTSGTTYPQSSFTFDYAQPFFYTQSITIELMQNAGSCYVYGFCDYATT